MSPGWAQPCPGLFYCHVVDVGADRLDPLVDAQPSILDLSFEQYEGQKAREDDVNQPSVTASERTG